MPLSIQSRASIVCATGTDIAMPIGTGVIMIGTGTATSAEMATPIAIGDITMIGIAAATEAIILSMATRFITGVIEGRQPSRA